MEQKIQSSVLRTEAGKRSASRRIWLIGTVWGEVYAQIEAGYQEMQRQQETIRVEMTKITDDVQLLTTRLNDAKLVNKDMLSEVELE